jgi:hypothetical protein
LCGFLFQKEGQTDLLVRCPAIECDSRERSNDPSEPRLPIELVVLGNAELIHQEGPGDYIHEVSIAKVLYGNCPRKTVRFSCPWRVEEKAPAIFAFIPSIYDRDAKAAYYMKYSLPASEEKSMAALAAARLDYNALSSAAIFIGIETKTGDDYKHMVKVRRVLHGDKPKNGETIQVRVDLYARHYRETPRFRSEPEIFFIRSIRQEPDDNYPVYYLNCRLPASEEPKVLSALQRKDSYPIIKNKDGEYREIIFRGGNSDAIDLMGSVSDAAVLLGVRRLTCEKESAKADILAAIEKDLLLTPEQAEGRFRRLRNLIMLLGGIGEGKPDGIAGKLIDRCIAHVSSAPLQPPTPTRRYGNPYHTGEEHKVDVNHALTWLLATLLEQDVVKHYGDRLLKLRDSTAGQWRAEVQLALDASCVEDNIELSAAMKRMQGVAVIRTARPNPPSENEPSEELTPFDVITALFRPADRASLIFSPDGKTIQTYTQEGVVRRRDSTTLNITKTISLPREHDFIGARPSDGRYALCARILVRDHGGHADKYGPFKIVDLKNGKTVCDVPLAIHWRHTNTKLAWLPDDILLIIDGGIWYRVNYLTGKIIEKVAIDIRKQNGLYNGRGWPTEDGRHFYILDGGGKCNWLEVSTHQIRSGIEEKLGTINLNYGCWCNDRGLVPGGKYFFFGDPGLYIYNRETLKPVIVKEFKHADILGLQFSPDGTRYAIVTGGRMSVSDELKIHDPQIRSIIRVHDTVTGRTLFAFYSSTRWTRAMTFSPDGKRLVLLREDGVIEARQL